MDKDQPIDTVNKDPKPPDFDAHRAKFARAATGNMDEISAMNEQAMYRMEAYRDQCEAEREAQYQYQIDQQAQIELAQEEERERIMEIERERAREVRLDRLREEKREIDRSMSGPGCRR